MLEVSYFARCRWPMPYPGTLGLEDAPSRAVVVPLVADLGEANRRNIALRLGGAKPRPDA